MKPKLYLTLAVAALAALQPTLLPAQTTPMPQGFVMVGGKTYVVQQGVATPLNHEMTLRITPDGIVGFDNRPRSIPGNNMMTLDGRVVAAPQGLVYKNATPAVADPRLQDRGIYGQTVSGLAPTRSLGASGASLVSTTTPLASANRGPRDIIAKKGKSTVSKTKKATSSTSSSTAAKRTSGSPTAVAKERPAAPSTPVFSGELIPLPSRGFDDNGEVAQVIDAQNTMLSMTKVPEEPAPDIPTLSASLRLGITPGEDANALEATAPPPPLPATMAPLPSLLLPPSSPLPVAPAP